MFVWQFFKNLRNENIISFLLPLWRHCTAKVLEATRIVIKYQLCVTTNSCVFNCKPDNKNRNPENVWLFMALVKKGQFFMAFSGHKISIIISYHFYGFLWLRTNPVYKNNSIYWRDNGISHGETLDHRKAL